MRQNRSIQGEAHNVRIFAGQKVPGKAKNERPKKGSRTNVDYGLECGRIQTRDVRRELINVLRDALIDVVDIVTHGGLVEGDAVQILLVNVKGESLAEADGQHVGEVLEQGVHDGGGDRDGTEGQNTTNKLFQVHLNQALCVGTHDFCYSD